ncbi:hypothetical protein CGA22_26305 [Pseudomonas sp. PSB18]|nr:hypothetical protein [Pseudomonas sp. PSB18]
MAYANAAHALIQCGSELARDGGGSACIDVDCAAVIASRLAPTGIGVIPDVVINPQSGWERACSRWRCFSRSVQDHSGQGDFDVDVVA